MTFASARRARAGSAVLAALALASADVAAEGAAAAAQTLRMTAQGDALTLDPHARNEGPTIVLTGMVYEALTTRDAAMVLQPELATSWTPVEGGWRFALRPGVAFQGGESFDAQDVAFSIRRAAAPGSDWKEQLAGVTGVEVVDPLTVIVRTDGPNPILPNQLTNVFIMDEGWAEANGAAQVAPAGAASHAALHANGTGPFQVAERRPDELTVLDANAAWWGRGLFPGDLARIEFRPIRAPATRTAALLAGDVDLMLDPPVQDLARIRATPGFRVETTPQVRSIFLGMDQSSPELRSSDATGRNPFADPRVREAMNLAVDRAAIRDHVMEGMSVPAGALTPQAVHGVTPAVDAPAPFDPERARALLAEAGYPDGFAVTLDCPNDRYINDERICRAVAGMYARVGVRVTVDAQPKARHFPKVNEARSDFYLLGWGTPTLDSAFVLEHLVAGPGPWNATGYAPETLARLVRDAGRETDPGKRDALLAEAWAMVRRDLPYVPLHHQVIAWAMSDRVTAPISADNDPRPRFVRLAP